MRPAGMILVAALLSCRPRAAEDSRAVSAESAAPIGTANPVTVIQSAANGRWIVVCQARRDTDGKPGIAVQRTEDTGFWGDAMVPYLVRGSGEGVAIESFVAASHGDRWIAIVRDRALVLIDTVHAGEQVLADADVRGEESGGRIVAAFDDRDEHLVYARWFDGRSRVVIRDLATREESALDVDGTLWQLEAAPATGWLEMTYISASVLRSGHVAWPRLVSTVPAGRVCGFDPNAGGRISSTIAARWLRPDTREIRDDHPSSPRDVNKDAKRAWASFGANQLTLESDAYRIINTATGVVTALPGVDGNVGRQAGSMVAIGTAVVDLATARVLGTVARPPLAVDATGRALVPDVAEGSAFQVAVGPLRWMTPTPTTAP
jgi:hypothetical protein